MAEIKKNQNVVERFIRILIGGLCILAATYIAMPTAGVFVLVIIGLYLMLSGLAGNCFFYRLMGIDTCK